LARMLTDHRHIRCQTDGTRTVEVNTSVNIVPIGRTGQ
jgi:hypothetical protein